MNARKFVSVYQNAFFGQKYYRRFARSLRNYFLTPSLSYFLFTLFERKV